MLHCCMSFFLSHLLAVQAVISDHDDLSATEGKSLRDLFIYFLFFLQGVGTVGRAGKVEWGHQVGNLWPSF